MPVTPVRTLIFEPGKSNIRYKTCDGKYYQDLDKAITHDNKYHRDQTPDAVYEQIWTIQEAINKAVAEHRVVRFLSKKTNKEIKAQIDDIKGCKLMKPERNSDDTAVIPPGINNFDFNEVDTSIIVKGE